MKKIITITYKDGKTETRDFNEFYFWSNFIEIKTKDDKDSIDVELNKIKEIKIK